MEEFKDKRMFLMEKMRNSDDFFKKFGKLDDEAFAPGVIPKKYKELTMISVSIVSKCTECITYHIEQSIKEGATLPELIEAIKMGMMAAGSTTYPYIRHSFSVLFEMNLIQ